MLKVDLKPLDDTDLPILLAWAHIPEIWRYLPTSRQNEKLTWDDHNKWFYFKRNNRFDWLILVDDRKWKSRPVGVVHAVEVNREYPEVGLYIGDTNLWGKFGIGRKALGLVMERIVYYSYIKGLHAVIHPENKKSIRLFTNFGFIKIGKAREGQELYEYTFNRPEVAIPLNQEGDRLSYQQSPA